MFGMLRIYTPKIEIFINCAIEKRNKFPCFLSGPEKTYGQDLLVIKNKTLNPLNGKVYLTDWSQQHSILFSHSTFSPYLQTPTQKYIFWVFTMWILHQIRILSSKEFYAICHRMVPQISTGWKLALELLLHSPGGENREMNVGAEATAIQISLSWDWGIRRGKSQFLTA